MKALIKSKKIIITAAVFISSFAFSAWAFAASGSALYNPVPVAQQLYCPTSACDLQTFVLLIMGDFLRIIPIFSVLFIIIGGFRLIMSSGNEEAITKAKRTIAWAVIGLVVALLSFSIIAIVQNALQVTIQH